MKKMSLNEIRDFMFENYYKRIGFSEENNYLFNEKFEGKRFIVACKQVNRKYTWSSQCQRALSIIYKKEKHKTSKTIKNNQGKTFENPNIVDIKSTITEHPKTWHKLSKIIIQAEKVSSNSFLYCNTKKVKLF